MEPMKQETKMIAQDVSEMKRLLEGLAQRLDVVPAGSSSCERQSSRPRRPSRSAMRLGEGGGIPANAAVCVLVDTCGSGQGELCLGGHKWVRLICVLSDTSVSGLGDVCLGGHTRVGSG